MLTLYAILKQKSKQKLQEKPLKLGDFAGSVGKMRFFEVAARVETGNILEQAGVELSGPAKVVEVEQNFRLFRSNWEIGLTGGETVWMETVYTFLKHASPGYVPGKHFDSRS